jgi:hypothetical protein
MKARSCSILALCFPGGRSLRSLSSDTDPEAERILIEGYRRMPVWEKLQRVGELNELVQSLAMADIRRRHPDASPRECALRLASRWLDADLMRKAFGWDPDKEGY